MNHSRLPFLFALAASAWLALGSIAGASELDLTGALAEIARAEQAGEIDGETALVLKFVAAFEPEKLPVRFLVPGEAPPEASFCATGLILEASAGWSDLSPWARDRISSHVPIRSLARLGEGNAPARSEPPKGLPDEEYDGDYSPPNTMLTTHFRIGWWDDCDIQIDELETLGETLEWAWDVDIDQLDYLRPFNTDRYYTNVYIGNSGEGSPNVSSSVGGYANIHEDEDLAYFVLNPRTFDDPLDAESTPAHEFFHVIQFGYVFENGQLCYYYAYPGPVLDFWFWEATATWSMNVVYPENNDYARYVELYAEAPHESLHTLVRDYYPYSRTLFVNYVEEHHGGVDWVRQVWEECDFHGSLSGIDGYLDTQGTDLAEAFVDFMGRNAVMDYEDGAYYGTIETIASYTAYPVLEKSVTAAYRPRYLGANFIEFNTSVARTGRLTLSFDGDDKQDGEDVTWRVGIVLKMSGGEYELGEMKINDRNMGQIEIPRFGEKYKTVFMIPAVTQWEVEDGTLEGVDYMYAAELDVAGEEDEGEGGDDDDDDDEGCGCK